MSSGPDKHSSSCSNLRRGIAALFTAWFAPKVPPSSWLRSAEDPLEIPVEYGNLPLELRYCLPLGRSAGLLTILDLLGIATALCFLVLGLGAAKSWLANQFALSLLLTLAFLLAVFQLFPGRMTRSFQMSITVALLVIAMLIAKSIAGSAAFMSILAITSILLACVLADQLTENWLRWHLAGTLLTPPEVSGWEHAWQQRFAGARDLRDYWVGFVIIAGAVAGAMALSTLFAPPGFVGLAFACLICLFLTASVGVSVAWQPRGVAEALRAAYEPLIVWFRYNPDHCAAPGLYQSPFLARRLRVWFVSATLSAGFLPLAGYFPLHAALSSPTSPTNAATRTHGPITQSSQSWMVDATWGAAKGDPRHTWALLAALLSCIAFPAVILTAICMLVASRTAPRIRAGTQSPPTGTEPDFDKYVNRLLNSRYVHAGDIRERDHLFIGVDTIHGRPILLSRKLLDGHAHILGSTQSGKTALALTPMISQLIRALRPGSREYTRQSSMMILDLKGDLAMFQNTRLECERRGVRFKYFSLGYRDASYAFNPFEQTHLRDVSPDQRADMLAQAIGILYGHKYPEVYWSDLNAQVFRALLLNYPEIRSFACFHHYIKDPSWYQHTGGKLDEWKRASHVKAAADKLARITPLNVTEKDTPSATVFRDRIDLRNLGSRQHEPEVVYFFIRATDDEMAGHTVAKLALFSLLAAVNTVPARDKKRAYVLIDEFQYIALDTLARLFEQAAGLKVSFLLANQSLHTLPDIIQEVLAENTAFRQIFRAGSIKARRNVRDRSAESIYRTYSFTSSNKQTSTTAEEHIGPGYFDSEITRSSYDNAVSWVEMSAPRGFSQYGGHIFTIRTPYHISKAEYERRERLRWPERDASTMIAAESAGILDAYRPHMMTQAQLADDFEDRLQPGHVPPPASLQPIRVMPDFDACVDALEESFELTRERVRAGTPLDS